MNDNQISLADRIYRSEITREPIETALGTDEQVLDRITDGIYRQPASALRELISNAYDADATQVVILTDAPRFSQISVRDDGRGLSPKVIGHLVRHIGGSAKRTEEGRGLSISAADDEEFSPSGRRFIGKLGIGLFSVAQFTRHFLIITKVAGDNYRTISDIVLSPVAGQQGTQEDAPEAERKFKKGSALIWREPATDTESHGTEIRLLELLPRTRAELASEDRWARVEYEDGIPGSVPPSPPKFHIGRMAVAQPDMLSVQPNLPWLESDQPRERFVKFAAAIRNLAGTESETVDLTLVCDKYLQTLWDLSLSAPLKYLDAHPFDIPAGGGQLFFRLENSLKGQSEKIALEGSQTPRNVLHLVAPNGDDNLPFQVFVDGMELLRPIVFKGLPKTDAAVQTPLMFIGSDNQQFAGKPEILTGGPLVFEAYLYWAPKIVPKQHQGVMVRVGNASGTLFDRTFMGYQVSEQTRTRQITAEIFVRQGLDDAINIDRESFNYAHPHYQYLVRWLHSALRQLANKHKAIGAQARGERLVRHSQAIRTNITLKVEEYLKVRGVEDIPNVRLVEVESRDAVDYQLNGEIVLWKEGVFPDAQEKANTAAERERRNNAEVKAVAVTQLLHGWGLLNDLSYSDREQLVHDILGIAAFDI